MVAADAGSDQLHGACEDDETTAGFVVDDGHLNSAATAAKQRFALEKELDKFRK